MIMAPINYGSIPTYRTVASIKKINSQTKEIEYEQYVHVHSVTASIGGPLEDPQITFEGSIISKTSYLSSLCAPNSKDETITAPKNIYKYQDHSKRKSFDCCGIATACLKHQPNHNRMDTDGDPEFVSLNIDRVIFNNPATIIFWKDGSKTTVKCTKGQEFNKYYGFCAAVAKHALGNNSRINQIVAQAFDQEETNPSKKVKKVSKKDKKIKKGKKHD